MREGEVELERVTYTKEGYKEPTNKDVSVKIEK